MTMHPVIENVPLRTSLGVDQAVLADIRAVGAVVQPRIAHLVEDFYRWLEPLPEFARFFTDDRALLARVKSQQLAYWKDFLQAVVDDAYVERRRVVGQVHARIELGLFIYLRAMDFASMWLVRAVEDNEQLSIARPSATFAIRKLIQFDSAIVVHTYATRTAEMLEQQRDRLQRAASVMRAVTEGDLDHQLDVTSADDQLGTSVNDMVKSLRNIAQEMRTIARGDYSADIAPRSNNDALGAALQSMTRALRDVADKNDQHLWRIRSQAKLAEVMSGNPSIHELSENVLAYLCQALDAQVGIQYFSESGSDVLRVSGTYGTSEGNQPRKHWRFGEGLVGRAALDKRRFVLEEVPEDCVRIQWGLGEAVPRSLAIVPLVHDGEVRGVIELGSLGRFSQPQLDLLDHASASVALAITAAETRAQVQQLLEESQAQAEELTSQQEELRAVNEVLERQARALEIQKESLVATETTLRQKAAELERASRYKSEFLANMSHELRTPLNSSLILAKLMMRNSEGNLTAEQVKYAQSIYSAGNDLLSLINDILDLSKIEAGKVELEVQPIDVHHFVDGMRQRFEPLISEKALAFSVGVAPDCHQEITTDRQRLQQILTNLLSNAIKFTEQGSIQLRVARDGPQQVAFVVQDTGIGIRSEHHDVIFDAFRQADGTTNRRFGGTGLGLSICRELANVLGGEVLLQSALGEGSTFTLKLPLETQPTAMQPAVDSPRRFEKTSANAPTVDVMIDGYDASSVSPRLLGARSTGAPKNLLVVEDDATQRHAISKLLVADDVRVAAVSSAIDALNVLESAEFDCVIVDLMLPQVSGFELLERMASDSRHSAIPVIVYTARALSSTEEQTLQRYSKSIIIKSARSPERLHYEVNNLLHRTPSERPPPPLMSVKPEHGHRVFESRRILLVEDDVRNIFALTSVLESTGAMVDVARNGLEALARLEKGPPVDVVLMDVMMPEMDGVTAMREIRSRDGWGSIPIIALTAKAMPDDRQQCLDAGANDYIAKPIDVDQLLSMLTEWMPM